MWDSRKFSDGIGSNFQHIKRGLVLANALDATWIGDIENSHAAGHNHAEYFGLGSEECSNLALSRLHAQRGPNGFHARQLRFHEVPHFAMRELCAVVASPNRTSGATAAWHRARYGVDHRSVVTTPPEMTEDWNYCTFNAAFRTRFAAARVRRGVRPRPPDALWVGVHFRWGDTQTGDVTKPDGRAGGPLELLAVRTAQYLEQHAVRTALSKC